MEGEDGVALQHLNSTLARNMVPSNFTLWFGGSELLSLMHPSSSVIVVVENFSHSIDGFMFYLPQLPCSSLKVPHSLIFHLALSISW